MRRLIVFNSVSVDGFFVDAAGGMNWAYSRVKDPEWDAFVDGNASGGGVLLFGRVTYEMMASYWPTPLAAQNNPAVAEGINKSAKVVFSRTLAKATWNNTKLIKDDVAGCVRKLKSEPGNGMVILGSGSIVSQLASEGLIDEYQFVMVPVALGEGRSLFEGMKKSLPLTLTSSRAFKNGNVVLCYQPGES